MFYPSCVLRKSISIVIHPAFLFLFRLIISSIYYVIETLEEWLGKQWDQIPKLISCDSIHIELGAHMELKEKCIPSRGFLMGILQLLTTKPVTLVIG